MSITVSNMLCIALATVPGLLLAGPESERDAAFENRHTPETINRLARDFLNRLVLDPSVLSRPGLTRVAELAGEERYPEALEVFRDYYIDKLRDPSVYGLGDRLTRRPDILKKPADAQKAIDRANQLLAGNLVADGDPMPPGAVDLPPGPPTPNGRPMPWNINIYQPLAEAFILTGDKAYLEKWADYVDDWCIRESYTEAIRPTDISDKMSGSVGGVLELHRLLGGIARMEPEQRYLIPADTLARLLTRAVRDLLPLSLLYHGTNPQNWTPGGSANLIAASMLLDEFKASDTLFNRSRARHENYGTIQFLPDGSETEHELWYNVHYFDGGRMALNLASDRNGMNDALRPAWEKNVFTPFWFDVQTGKIEQRARFFIQMLTPQREYPIGNRSDKRKLPDWKSEEMVNFAAEKGSPSLKNLLHVLKGEGEASSVGYADTAFPYGGYFVIRSGWEKTADYAHFFCSPYPSGGHAMRGLKSNNGFWLAESGYDLLVAGGFGNYSYDRSPLRVDGLEQFYNAGIANPGGNKSHKGFAVAYIDPQPPPWRSLAGDHISFVEGVYDGPYGFLVDDHHDNKDYSPDFLAERARAAIRGIRHQRQVVYIRNHGVWIVVDRLESDKPRTYSLDWRLPVTALRDFGSSSVTKHQSSSFVPEEIEVSADQGVIRTIAEKRPNITIRQLGVSPTFETGREDAERIKDDYTLNYLMHDFWRVSATWESPGNDLVISVITTRGGAEPDPVVNFEDRSTDEAVGFELALRDGVRAAFAAARNEAANLAAFDVTSHAEALLVVGPANGEPASGLVLGGDAIEVSGQALNPPQPDGAFVLSNPASFNPVYRPIGHVRIHPERNVFAGEETIELNCETPGVEIRYTLDSSEPTPDSELYDGPFRIRETTTVKARAFRPGLEKAPDTLAGTLATPTAIAQYKQQTPLMPVAPADAPAVTPGLHAVYRTGPWQDLVFFPDSIPVERMVEVASLFEGCHPDPARDFAWTYDGFLAIPESGVYTFHAPEEMVLSSVESGYSLRMFVGREASSGRMQEWYPATTRHAYGTWSIPLQEGLHPFRVEYVDYRMDAVERLNHPDLLVNTIWDGTTPALQISGPGLPRQPIPGSWYQKGTL